MNRNRTISAQAIQTAVNNAAKMFVQGYTAAQDSAVPSFFIVDKPNGEFYIVDTFAGFEVCNCIQCQREGHCKHIEFALETANLLAREAENDEREAARYEVIAGKY